MKRLFPLLLCLCALCGCTGGAEDTAPPQTLFTQTVATEDSTWWPTPAAAVPADPDGGTYLQLRFRNDTDRMATAYLFRLAPGRSSPGSLQAPDLRLQVEGGTEGSAVYHHRTAADGSYYLMAEATQEGGSLAGQIDLVQSGSAP